ncbi:hypothetical protein BPAE_0206g00020 [Botrytis paeoniae]|uniref:Cytochrome P450 n=1 Tax=Botrytis paeoniae TaxID=278948 RepID=A0A4Z1FEB7_9HELO|nr:hypothetical protein BPAE_0206g00020 [Botrytis paeoniae]
MGISGPIVRINPYEVHLNDPDFIDSVFPGPGRQTDKYFFAGRRTEIATIDHDMHQKRRNTITNFFSNASIRRLEPVMKEHINTLLSRMQVAGTKEQVLSMHFVFRACTSDLITQYAFGKSFHFLEQEDFSMPYMESTDVGTLLALAPPWAIKIFIPSLTEMWDKAAMSCPEYEGTLAY